MSEKISVIVPVYNGEKYLDRCIKSILNQSYDNIELVLVDDGSPDNSGEICDSYLADSRVKVIHKNNEGVAIARRQGVSASSGEYVTFVDCDDWISSDMLEYLYSLIKSGDYQISSCGYKVVRSEDIPSEAKEEKLTVLDFEGMTKGLYDYSLWSMCFKLYKKSLFDNIEVANDGLTVSEDLVQNYFISKRIEKIVISNLDKYYYFRHSDSAMAVEISLRRVNDQIKAYKIIYDDFDKNSVAFSYQAANRLINDFSLLNQIINKKLDKELYNLVRADILECKGYVFDKKNSYCFGFKHKLGVRLICYMPALYNLMIKLLK